jgi:hypothetical protein
LSDPVVAQRLRQGGGALAASVADPALSTAQGLALLGRQATVEANVLAYDDVFGLVAAICAVTTLYLTFLNIRRRILNRRQGRLPEGASA